MLAPLTFSGIVTTIAAMLSNSFVWRALSVAMQVSSSSLREVEVLIGRLWFVANLYVYLG